jgi:signal transduction histidine kinase
MTNELTIFIVSGTFGSLVMAFSIIYFVVSYQKKRFNTQIEIEHLKTQSEKEATLASFRGQENERQRIAEDLHDDIGASLTAIKMGMNFLVDKLDDHKALKKELIDIRDTLAISIENVRGISHNLMPYALSNLDLCSSVKQLVNSLTNPPKYDASFHMSGELIKLNDEVRLMLFRSIQEIINNSIKHSEASQLTVDFTWEKELLGILVKDNGCGFNYKEALSDANAGLGLRNLESRFRIIDVTHQVKSDTNGTTYNIVLPLNGNTILL